MYYPCLVGERDCDPQYIQVFLKQKCLLFFITVSVESWSAAMTMSFQTIPIFSTLVGERVWKDFVGNGGLGREGGMPLISLLSSF